MSDASESPARPGHDLRGPSSREYPARPIASAAAVILRGERVPGVIEVILVQRGFPPRKGIWTFPGGAVEVGETVREACAREVLEETGLTVHVGPVIEAVDVMQADEARWRYHYTIMDFLAELDPASGPLCAGSDACDARWVAVDTLEPYDLTPVALHVLRRALWLRESGVGPQMPGDVRTLIG
jgi:ADP-ribose pyrophosphatase YjhB (NUDIX family)